MSFFFISNFLYHIPGGQELELYLGAEQFRSKFHTVSSTPTSILSRYVLLCVHSFQSWVNFQWIFHLHLILFGTNYDVISSVLLLLNPTYTKILPSISQSRAHVLKRGSHAQRYTHTFFLSYIYSHSPLNSLFSKAPKHPFLTREQHKSKTKLFNKHLISQYFLL